MRRLIVRFVAAIVVLNLVLLAVAAPVASLADSPVDVPGERRAESVPATATNAGLTLEPESLRTHPELSPRTPRDRSPGLASASRLAGENITIPRKAKQNAASSTPTPWYRNGLVSLGVVLVAIVGVGMLARRFLMRSQVSGAELMRVLSRTYLSPKQSIVLVQMGGRFAFLGVTPDRISTLRVVEDEEEAGALRSELRVKRIQENQTAFAELLTDEEGRVGNHLEPALAAGPNRSTQVSKTRGELKGLLEKLRSRNAGRTPRRGERSKSASIG